MNDNEAPQPPVTPGTNEPPAPILGESPAPAPAPITAPTPNQIAPTPQPLQPSVPGSADPGKTLGVVGFILAFVANLFGLILSIIALNKSKKAGYKNGLALAGIIISSIGLVLGIIGGILFAAIVLTAAGKVAERCSDLGTSSVSIDGKRYVCTSNTGSTKTDTATTGSATSIANTPVTAANGVVSAACFTFTQPASYIISPNSKTCQTELRLDNGSSTGVSLTAIFVKAQTGNNDVDDFFTKYEAAGANAATKERLTIGDEKAGKITIKDSNGIEQATYFIEDTTGNFEASNGPITSYLIYGPAASTEQLSTIVNSFKTK